MRSPSPLEQLAAAHKALGHPVRLRILAMLQPGELCACQVTAVLKLAPSTVSAHLAELRRAGLIAVRKEHRWMIFRHADDRQARSLVRHALQSLARDERTEEDARIVRRLRRVPLEQLCRADLCLTRLGIRELAGPASSTRRRKSG